MALRADWIWRQNDDEDQSARRGESQASEGSVAGQRVETFQVYPAQRVAFQRSDFAREKGIRGPNPR